MVGDSQLPTIAKIINRSGLDESQELYYPAIMRAIAATNYGGYVGPEFSPVKDASIRLEMAYRICAM